MNTINKLLIIILFTNIVMINPLANTNQVSAAGPSLVTHITAWPDSYFYADSETIEIEVSVWDEDGQAESDRKIL